MIPAFCLSLAVVSQAPSLTPTPQPTATSTLTFTSTRTPTPKPWVSGYTVSCQLSPDGSALRWVYSDAAGRVPQGAEGVVRRNEAETLSDFVARAKAELKAAVGRRPDSWDDSLDQLNSPRNTPTPFQIRNAAD